jgi:hypothetical protein
LALAKANVAAVLLASTFVAIAWIGKRWRLAVSMYALAGVLSILFLLLAGINPFLVIKAYVQWGERVLSLKNFIYFILFKHDTEPAQTFVLLIPFFAGLVILALRTDWISKQNSAAGISRRILGFLTGVRNDLIGPITFFLIGTFTTVIVTGTNNSFDFQELPPLLTGAVFLSHSAEWHFRGARIRTIATSLIAASVILLTANALKWTCQRTHIYYVGPGMFYEDLPLTRLTAPPFFNGMNAGPKLAAVLNEIAQVLKTEDYRLGATASVFFGPRIDFAYAAFGIRPVPGFPLWWEAFHDDGKPRTAVMVERFKKTRFKLAVFLRRDYTFFPPSLIEYLNREYIAHDTNTLTIHVLREGPGEAQKTEKMEKRD